MERTGIAHLPEPRIMGGMFGLPAVSDLHEAGRPPFLGEKSLLLANARSGISLVAQKLSPARVWMPSYLCPAMLQALAGSSAEVRFYAVGYDLDIPSLDWTAELQPGDLVLLVSYFGRPIDPECARRAGEKGAWVLEDASQSLLSAAVGQCTDLVLFSPRKFLGVPDGGILTPLGRCDLGAIDLAAPPPAWWLKAFMAAALRAEFDRHGGPRRWFELFQEVEREQPIGGYAMSELAQALLTHAFDYPAIAARRVENYRFLAGRLGDVALFPDLPEGAVPLGFPIRVQNRDALRHALFAHQIYPPIHWPIAGLVPPQFADSHRLSAEIMTLPCDQRYGREEMAQVARIVRQELRS